MAYFIGNGNIKIGGGSLGRTEQMPTLKLLCVDLCARHLDRLSNLGDMPTEVFIDLLKRAKGKATPELVQRLQDQNERLVCDEVDVAYWKQAVEDHILRRTVSAPGPLLVEKVNDHKERLVELQAAADPSSPSKDWGRDVAGVLTALDEVPASVGLLRETLIAKTVGPLRKNADPEVARRANDLVRRWKEAARSRPPEQPAFAHSKFPSRGSGAAGGGGGAGASGERAAVEMKQGAIEDGFRCCTWNALYQHLERLRGEKVRASSKRAREAKEREQQKRPKMIVGKSRGEDFVKGRHRKSSGIKVGGPPSSASSSRYSGHSPPPKKKPQSGGRYGDDEITSIAELRRKVVIDQRLSAPVNANRRGGGAAAGRGPSPKQSKFWQ